MEKSFKGRIIIGGNLKGKAVVSNQAFNSLAAFYHCVLTNSNQAICNDQNNAAIYGLNLTNKIICAPKTIGSTSAGAIWDSIASMKIAPKALLIAEKIDSLGAAGVVLADIWTNSKIIAIDQLGQEFLNTVKTGDEIEIKDDLVIIKGGEQNGK